MKKSVVTLAILLFSVSVIAQKVTPDKYLHAGAGAGISATIYTLGQNSERDMNPVAPTLIAFTVGFGKEMYDSFTTDNFSGKDLLWTTASAAVVNTVLHFAWNKNKRYKRKSKQTIEFKEDFPLVKRQ